MRSAECGDRLTTVQAHCDTPLQQTTDPMKQFLTLSFLVFSLWACTSDVPKTKPLPPSSGGLTEGDSLGINLNPDSLDMPQSGTQNGQKNNPSPIPVPAIERSFAILTNLKEENGKIVGVEVDNVQFWKGDRAIEEARKRGDAEEELDDYGKKHYFVPNNFYMINANKQIRGYDLASNAQIWVVDYKGNKMFHRIGTIAEVREKVDNQVPFLVKVQNGKVISIREEYIP